MIIITYAFIPKCCSPEGPSKSLPAASKPDPRLLSTFLLQCRIILEPTEKFLCALDGAEGRTAFNGSEVAGRNAVKPCEAGLKTLHAFRPKPERSEMTLEEPEPLVRSQKVELRLEVKPAQCSTVNVLKEVGGRAEDA